MASEELRRKLDEEDINKALAEDAATNGDVIPTREVQLYQQAAALACKKLGLGPEYYNITVPEDQRYMGKPVSRNETRILIEGAQDMYGSGSDGGVLGIDPLYDALDELRAKDL